MPYGFSYENPLVEVEFPVSHGGVEWRSNACDTKRRTVSEMDCFKYLRSRVAADGGCEMNVVHRMIGGYKAWGALKSVLDVARTANPLSN